MPSSNNHSYSNTEYKKYHSEYTTIKPLLELGLGLLFLTGLISYFSKVDSVKGNIYIGGDEDNLNPNNKDASLMSLSNFMSYNELIYMGSILLTSLSSKYHYTSLPLMLPFLAGQIKTAEGSPTFVNSFSVGGGNEGSLESVIVTSDGGYLAVGSRLFLVSNPDDYDIAIAKFNSNGAFSWSRAWGSVYRDYANFVTHSSAGGYIIAGSYGYSASDRDAFLGYMNTNGDFSWTRSLGGSSDEAFFSACSTEGDSRDEIIATGITCSVRTDRCDLLLARFNINGDRLWTKTLGDERTSFIPNSVLNDFGKTTFLVAGEMRYSVGPSDIFVAKFSSIGNLLWMTKIGWPELTEFANEIKLDYRNEKYVITGSVNDGPFGDSDAFLAKIRPDGYLEWVSIVGGDNGDYGLSVDQTSDGQYILAGYTYSATPGTTRALLTKFNAYGDVIWSKALGYGFRAYSVKVGFDGKYVLCGVRTGYQPFLAKVNALGEISPCGLLSNYSAFQDNSMNAPSYNSPSYNNNVDVRIVHMPAVYLTSYTTSNILYDAIVRETEAIITNYRDNYTCFSADTPSPTQFPTAYPTLYPTVSPSSSPTFSPSTSPSFQPTGEPTFQTIPPLSQTSSTGPNTNKQGGTLDPMQILALEVGGGIAGALCLVGIGVFACRRRRPKNVHEIEMQETQHKSEEVGEQTYNTAQSDRAQSEIAYQKGSVAGATRRGENRRVENRKISDRYMVAPHKQPPINAPRDLNDSSKKQRPKYVTLTPNEDIKSMATVVNAEPPTYASTQLVLKKTTPDTYNKWHMVVSELPSLSARSSAVSAGRQQPPRVHTPVSAATITSKTSTMRSSNNENRAAAGIGTADSGMKQFPKMPTRPAPRSLKSQTIKREIQDADGQFKKTINDALSSDFSMTLELDKKNITVQSDESEQLETLGVTLQELFATRISDWDVEENELKIEAQSSNFAKKIVGILESTGHVKSTFKSYTM